MLCDNIVTVMIVREAIKPTVFVSTHHRMLYQKNHFLDDFIGHYICLY